jgi:hypothetical protein
MCDQPYRKAATYIGQYKGGRKPKESRMPRVWFEHLTPVFKGKKIFLALDCAVTVTVLETCEVIKYWLIYIEVIYNGVYLLLSRPSLWSSGQSSWRQIQRSGFDFRRYQIFWEVVGLEWRPLSLVSTIEELLERKNSGSGLETENTAVGIRHADHEAHFIRKSWQ